MMNESHKTIQEATLRRLRANMVPMFTAAARAAAGETAWQDLVQELSPEARALVEAPPPRDAWVEAGLAAECMKLFVKAGQLGMVPATLGAETSRVRNPEAFATPAAVVAALPEFWRGTIEGGVLEAEGTGAGTAVVRLWAIWDAPPYAYDAHLPAWFSHALRISGAKDVSVGYTPPPSPEDYLHTYHLEWH